MLISILSFWAYPRGIHSYWPSEPLFTTSVFIPYSHSCGISPMDCHFGYYWSVLQTLNSLEWSLRPFTIWPSCAVHSPPCPQLYDRVHISLWNQLLVYFLFHREITPFWFLERWAFIRDTKGQRKRQRGTSLGSSVILESSQSSQFWELCQGLWEGKEA